ncbi:CDP-alcohol phosphatidyltransferase family protein [Aliihoeflea aestuarii]|jgi:phosphatidylglycerophosphate synthase|nr:CDP-alcohol phosphatidyltransferase family protein [Aliihoeflea aestuarii]
MEEIVMDVTARRLPYARGLVMRTALWLQAVGLVVCIAAVWLDMLGYGSGVAAILLYLVVAACVITRISGSHPHEAFGAANAVTLVRAGMIALVAATAFETLDDGAALAIAAFCGLALALDGIDGWLARRSGLASTFGARFDLEVDALFVLILSVCAYMHGKAGIWVLLIGLMRYGLLSAGFLSKRLEAPLPESLRRKAICVVQIAALALLLLPQIVPPVSAWIAAVALALLTWSFAVDIRYLLRRDRSA